MRHVLPPASCLRRFRKQGHSNLAEPAAARASSDQGFTLIEIMISIVVLLILIGITVATVGGLQNSDRVRGGARQVQSYISGGRDRAIYAASRQADPRELPPAIGVRLLPDPALSDLFSRPPKVRYSSMIFIQETKPPANLSATGKSWWRRQLDRPASGDRARSFRNRHGSAPRRKRPATGHSPADSTRAGKGGQFVRCFNWSDYRQLPTARDF